MVRGRLGSFALQESQIVWPSFRKESIQSPLTLNGRPLPDRGLNTESSCVLSVTTIHQGMVGEEALIIQGSYPGATHQLGAYTAALEL